MKIEVSSSEDAMTILDYIAFGVLLALMPLGVKWLFAQRK
jgi:hypothetical protein